MNDREKNPIYEYLNSKEGLVLLSKCRVEIENLYPRMKRLIGWTSVSLFYTWGGLSLQSSDKALGLFGVSIEELTEQKVLIGLFILIGYRYVIYFWELMKVEIRLMETYRSHTNEHSDVLLVTGTVKIDTGTIKRILSFRILGFLLRHCMAIKSKPDDTVLQKASSAEEIEAQKALDEDIEARRRDQHVKQWGFSDTTEAEREANIFLQQDYPIGWFQYLFVPVVILPALFVVTIVSIIVSLFL